MVPSATHHARPQCRALLLAPSEAWWTHVGHPLDRLARDTKGLDTPVFQAGRGVARFVQGPSFPPPGLRWSTGTQVGPERRSLCIDRGKCGVKSYHRGWSGQARIRLPVLRPGGVGLLPPASRQRGEVAMTAMPECQAWMLRELADLALSDPVRALEVIAPPARYLDAAYLRVACDLLEMAARRLRDGTFDLAAFSLVVDDTARSVRLSRRTVEAIWEETSDSARRRPRRSSRGQPLARFRPHLAEVAGRYTSLRQVGARFVGRCPLHDDSTPSFVCYPDGRFFCFGCLQWGDAVDLVSRKEGLSIPQAATRLAQEFGEGRSAPALLRQGKKTPLPRPTGALMESVHL